MFATLKRIYNCPDYCIGKWYSQEGAWLFDTIEDTVRKGPKVYGRTAIPAGVYKVNWSISPKFSQKPFYGGKMLALINGVPGFSGVRIHTGNTAADSLGCVLCGYNTVKGMVTDSRRAYRVFELKYYGMEFDLNIINAFTQPLT